MQHILHKHNPPHILIDTTFYAITSTTYRKIKYFDTDSKKQMLLEVIKEILSYYEFELTSWVVLDNHYHLLTKSKIGSNLPLIFRKIHSKSAVNLRKFALASRCTPNLFPGIHQQAGANLFPGIHQQAGANLSPGVHQLADANLSPGVHQLADAKIKIWHNYWDNCINDEASYFKRINYIHHNPVKHGYVTEMQDYKFSSYNYYLQNKGLEWINDVFETYPIIDYTDVCDV